MGGLALKTCYSVAMSDPNNRMHDLRSTVELLMEEHAAEKAVLLKQIQTLTAERDGLLADKQQATEQMRELATNGQGLLEKLKRLTAEFDNYQKRSKKEKLQWTAKTVSDVLMQFIPALDNLDFVLRDSAAISDPNEVTASLQKGLELIEEEFLKTLRQYDVKKVIPAPGDPFDANVHCAISMQHAEVEGEVIGQVARAGYIIKGDLIRPAEVIVSKNLYA